MQIKVYYIIIFRLGKNNGIVILRFIYFYYLQIRMFMVYKCVSKSQYIIVFSGGKIKRINYARQSNN